MFGNVIPLRCALTKEDIEIFDSYYCGLCREIGKRNQTARLGLSYDMTFLAILIDSLSCKEIEFEQVRRCILHPLKKQKIPCKSLGLLYAADVSVLLIKAKLDDDARDDGNFFKRLLSVAISDKMLFDKGQIKEAISIQLGKLDDIEKNDIRDADISSDCFAVLCSELFKKYLNTTPMGYVRDFRIEKSIKLMKSGMTISEAAHSTGFSELSHFSKVFRGKMNMSPKEYMEQSRRESQ